MTLIQFVELVPKVMVLVKMIEDMVPGEIPGEKKLNFILDLLAAAAKDVPGIVSSDGKIPAIVSLIVKVVVAFFNITGTFAKKAV